MTYEIHDDCLHCGMCASECPNSAISLNDAGNYEINQDSCIGCGTCAEICPTENIRQR
jgi:ferredoxin